MRSEAYRYSRALFDAKGKTVFSSDSKLIPDTDWNESKMSVTLAGNASP
jgi:outer membrane protease